MKLGRIFLIMMTLLYIAVLVGFAEPLKVTGIDEINKITLETGKVSLYGLSSHEYEFLAKAVMKDGYHPQNGLKQFFGDTGKVPGGDYDFAITYHDAIRLMDNLLTGKSVDALAVANTNQYLVTKNDVNINLLLVELGYVSVDRAGLVGDPVDDKLIIAENNARTSQKGIWGMKINQSETHNSAASGIPIPISIEDGLITVMIVCFVLGYSYWAGKSSRLHMMWWLLVFGIVVFWWIQVPNQLHWLNALLRIAMFVIVLLAWVTAFLNLSRNHKLTFSKSIFCIVLITAYIVLFFSALYYHVSNTQLEYLSEHTYYTIGGIQVKRELLRPANNYIDIPKDCYLENEKGEIYYYLSPRDAVYFSSTTLFTVGYGDMAAKGTLKNWALFEMFVGEILRLSIFAYLVSKVDFQEISLTRVDRFMNVVGGRLYHYFAWLKYKVKRLPRQPDE